MLTAPLLLFELGEAHCQVQTAIHDALTHAPQIRDHCATAPLWFNAHAHVDGAGGYRPVALNVRVYAELAVTHRRPADAGELKCAFAP
jgi:hypothetical protein